VLPLPDHHTLYYLTIPVIGLGMAAAYGFSCVARSPGAVPRLAAILIYLAGMLPFPVRRRVVAPTDRQCPRSGACVEAARETHPGKTIVLDAIPPVVYNDSIVRERYTQPIWISCI